MSKTTLQAIFDSIQTAIENAGMQTRELDNGDLEVRVPGSGTVRVTVEED